MLGVKNLPASEGDIRDTGLIPGSRRFPGGGHSMLTWRIPWTGEPGRIQFIELQSRTQLKWLCAHGEAIRYVDLELKTKKVDLNHRLNSHQHIGSHKRHDNMSCLIIGNCMAERIKSKRGSIISFSQFFLILSHDSCMISSREELSLPNNWYWIFILLPWCVGTWRQI